MGRLLAALVLSLFAAAPAMAQDDRSVLLVLDSSKSMNESAGSGGTRLDAAKAATKELLEAVPEDAAVGLRVYGSKVSETTRAEGCRDTELAIPVGPVDRAEVAATVDALEGKGRTPIGRSLLAAPDDLPPGGRRTVILVSDGGDNCAPPDPCRAAEEVSRRGIDMTIQVVGLQVNDRVRRQLQCIADAGGGTYVDATDADSLRAELAAAFARAFRPYEPSGKPIEGGPSADAAVTTTAGQYVDSVGPGQARWYSVDVEGGQRLFAAATLISKPPPAPEIWWQVEVALHDPQGNVLFDQTETYRTLNGRNPIGTVAASLAEPAPADGTYRFGVSVRSVSDRPESEVPVEVTFGTSGGEPDPAAPRADDAPRRVPREKATDVPELAGVGAGGLLLGALAGFLAMRRRRA